MAKGGGSTQQDSTTTSVPWAAQQPYLESGFRRADQAYSDPVRFPDFPTYASLTDSMMGARDALWNRGSNGSPMNAAATDWATDAMSGGGASGPLMTTAQNTIAGQMQPGGSMQDNAQFFNSGPGMDMLAGRAGGNMLGRNPYLDSQYDAAAGRVTDAFNRAVVPGINATFGSGGRTGGGLHQDALVNAGNKLGENLSDMATNMYGNAYNYERGMQDNAMSQYASQGQTGQQMGAGQYNADQNRAQGAAGLWGNLYGQDQDNAARAASMAPTIAGMDYTDINAMLNAGQIDQGQADAMVADRVNRFNFYETGAGSPQDAVARYIAAIQGNYGGTQSTNYDRPGSTTGRALGGGLSGAAAGFQVGGPWGALIGGGLGAISSLWS